MSEKTISLISKIKKQQTFCMVKPDGVMRGLIGEIIMRIEKSGLKIVALKMIKATEDQIAKHYPMTDEAWIGRLGDKGLGTFADLKIDPNEVLGTSDKKIIGTKVAQTLLKFMTSGPVVCMVVEGVQAIDMVRKLAGHTLPIKAEMGTIRGDFSVDSPAVANLENRSIHNLFHASENPEEAANEINLWFGGEVFEYTRVGEDVMYGRSY